MTPPLKIFYVEDNKQLSDLVIKDLKKLGYVVCGYTDNAPDAITGIQKSKPDLVIIDIELHGTYEGLSIGDFLVKNTDTPFIYTSGHMNESILEKARNTIPDGYLLKPFSNNQLQVISRWR